MSQTGGQRTQNLVFPVTLRPASAAIDVDGARVPLGAGMAVSAEIRTGSFGRDFHEGREDIFEDAAWP